VPPPAAEGDGDVGVGWRGEAGGVDSGMDY